MKLRINKNRLLQSVRELGLYLTVIAILIYVFEVDGVDTIRLGLLFGAGVGLWLFGLFNQAASTDKSEE